jgi:hypothetical protein
MKKLNLIQSNYKGFSFYFSREKINPILKDLFSQFSKKSTILNHFFFYFDDRFGCGFRLFVDSSLSCTELTTQFNQFIKTYRPHNQSVMKTSQFFATHQPFSVIPIKYIFESDEILFVKKEGQIVRNFLDNLNELIEHKLNDVDFNDNNQKLEFTLELLISGLAFNLFSEKNIQQHLKKYLKEIPNYEAYLKKNYAPSIAENKESIAQFKAQLLSEESTQNPLSKFWRKCDLNNPELILALIFKVLSTGDNQKCYCLYVLRETT